MQKLAVERLCGAPALLTLAALAALPGLAGQAAAQCTYNALTANTPVSSSSVATLYTFISPGNPWGAIGIRSTARSEHNLTVYPQSFA